jgi:hypothetical protein
MTGGHHCNRSERSNCFVFEIDRAEVDEASCHVTTTTTPVNIRVRGKGAGAIYACQIEVYHQKPSSPPKYCEFSWDQQSWQHNYIVRSEDLSSNTDHVFQAWVRRLGSAPLGPSLTLTVNFEHDMEDHRHLLDLRVSLR